MFLERLSLTNFRNIEKLDVSFGPGLNLLIGDNAQGKTNILEAIHLLSITKSFRTARERDLIRFGADITYIAGGGVEIAIQEGNKIIKLRGKEARAAEVLGNIRSVLFTPQDMNLLSGPPQKRRAYLDELIARVDRKYLLTLITYNKTLKQRNKLLWMIREHRANEKDLSSWDEMIVRDGSELVFRRYEVVARMAELLGGLTKEILGERVDLQYQANLGKELPSKSVIVANYMDKLIKGRSEEVRTATTLTGPHRDDLETLVGNRNLGRFGSRGEQRAAILGLKIAEVYFNEEESGTRPTLLLDDVLSELDKDHQERLLRETTKQQTIVTATDLTLFPTSIRKEAHEFEVKGGKIKETTNLV